MSWVPSTLAAVADQLDDLLEVEHPEMPCWMLLITASSAARWSVSFSSRCVSSNSRAFSSGQAHRGSSVCRQRTSAGP